jgi:hypothetical protein
MTRIGEIIETMSTGFVAESFELNHPPALGSLVVVLVPDEAGAAGASIDLYAVVTYGQTAGIDPSRRAVRRSTDEVFDQAIYQQNPELKRTLRTEFGAALVGFARPGQVLQHLPTQLPPLHFSVQEPVQEEVVRFTDRLQYLRLLAVPHAASGPSSSAGQVPPLQVLAASVRWVYKARGRDRAWLYSAAREIATLLKSDHEALLTVLYAIEPAEALDALEES